MHLTTQLWLRLKTLFRRKQLDRDLQDEVAFHLAMREEKNRTDGITRRRRALRRASPVRQHNADEGSNTRTVDFRFAREPLARPYVRAAYAFQSPRICRHR